MRVIADNQKDNHMTLRHLCELRKCSPSQHYISNLLQLYANGHKQFLVEFNRIYSLVTTHRRLHIIQ